LDVWGHVEQVHDLRQAGPGDVTEAGKLGLVGHDAIADELVEADRQSHQPGQTRDATGWDRLPFLVPTKLLLAAPAATEMDFGLDGDAVYAASSSCVANS